MSDSIDIITAEGIKSIKLSEICLADVDPEDFRRMKRPTKKRIKEYVVCNPVDPTSNYKSLIQTGVITEFLDDPAFPVGNFIFDTYITPRKAQHDHVCNLDGSPIFGGYLFGKMTSFAKLSRTLEVNVSQFLTDEAARNQLRPGSLKPENLIMRQLGSSQLRSWVLH